MNDALIIALVGIMAAPLASLVTWLVNRKKNVAETHAVLTESSQRAVETMQATMETLHEELLAAQIKIEKLIAENEKMQKEISLLRDQNNRLIDENLRLSHKIDELTIELRNR